LPMECRMTSADLPWELGPIEALVAHLLERYHAPLRAELPRLISLALRVELAHAGQPECPRGLAALLAEVREEIEGHLDKEEAILFPVILSGRGHTAYMPVQVMLQEHADQDEGLRRIRQLTRGFQLPAPACAAWRELYRSLEQLEAELLEHIHLENDVLFPRVLAG
jgi:regulator of cell morphogenesis and NO signaling